MGGGEGGGFCGVVQPRGSPDLAAPPFASGSGTGGGRDARGVMGSALAAASNSESVKMTGSGARNPLRLKVEVERSTKGMRPFSAMVMKAKEMVVVSQSEVVERWRKR